MNKDNCESWIGEIPLDYDHATGDYKVTVTVLEINDNPYWDERIEVEAGGASWVGRGGVKAGDVYSDVIRAWYEDPFTYQISFCKVKITIEPIS